MGQELSSSARKQVPVRQHRLFPVIVALWFAALLGLGSFAVPPEFLSRAVTATGLPAVLPAAAPPLGFTARALVALVLTGLGALTGFGLGRSFRARAADPVRRRSVGAASATPANAPKIRARDSHPDAAPRKPFTASEDMAPVENTANDPAPRRRALTMSDESVLAAPPELAPLPGSGPIEPLDLDALFAQIDAPVTAEPVAIEGPIMPDPVEAPLDLAIEAFVPAASEDVVPELSPAPTLHSHARQDTQFVPAPQPVAETQPRSPLADAPLDSLGVVQLVERLALAIAEYGERSPDRAVPQMLAAALAGSSPPAARPAARAPAADRPLPVVALHSVPMAPADPVSRAADFDDSAPLEQTARHLSFARTAESVSIAPGTAQPLAEPDAAPSEPVGSVEETVGAEASYSSLLDLKPVARPSLLPDLAPVDEPAEPSPRQMFIRVEAPAEPVLPSKEPVVVFPGQASRSAATGVPESAPAFAGPAEPALDPAEADRALRAALSTLQRMTGSR